MIFGEKKIINFKNFQKKNQGCYFIYDPELVSKLNIEHLLYELFKDPENVTQFPSIQYIDKDNELIDFNELRTNSSYFVQISTGSNNFFNYDAKEVKALIQSNLITILKEEEFIKSFDITNLIAMKERINGLEAFGEKNEGILKKKHQEILGYMLNYKNKLQMQTELYQEENGKLSEIEKELNNIADQYKKTRLAVEKNLFYYNEQN